MGFFSKLWRGVKKVVKKVGKGIKKVVGTVGKFVGKLGIVGQIGMFFLMPHVAGFLMKGLSAASSGLIGFANAASGTLGGTIAQGLGTVLKTAHSFAGTVGNVFGTITEGIGNFAKTALNKIPGVTIDGAATSFFGNDSAWSRTLDTGSKILDPFKGQTNFGKETTFADASKKVGIKESTLRELNPQLTGDMIPSGSNISTDFSSQGFKMAEAYKSGLKVAQPFQPLDYNYRQAISDQVGGDAFTGSIEGEVPSALKTYTKAPDVDFSYRQAIPDQVGEDAFTGSIKGEVPSALKTYTKAPDVDFSYRQAIPDQVGEDAFTGSIKGEVPSALKTYTKAPDVDYSYKEAVSEYVASEKEATSMLSRVSSTVGERFSSDPLGTISKGLDIAQQGKNLVADDTDYPEQRGLIQDLGNAAYIQNRQVAGVDTSWMQFGNPAYQSGYSNYNPFSYLQFMQTRTA
tara:strand:- start:282 stop:1658 length:1377 start_codon:yes stop_codon:yes gene_type:complete